MNKDVDGYLVYLYESIHGGRITVMVIGVLAFLLIWTIITIVIKTLTWIREKKRMISNRKMLKRLAQRMNEDGVILWRV